MSDRIAVMRHGRIEQLGPPEELYERPRTTFVAGFLGVSNLLEAEMVGREGRLAELRLADGTSIHVLSGELNGSGSMRVGVRPEKLKLQAESGEPPAPSDGQNWLQGTILDASYIGVSTQYLVATRDGHHVTVYSQNLDTSGSGQALAGGQRVRLTWQPEHTFVISTDSSEPSQTGEGEEQDD